MKFLCGIVALCACASSSQDTWSKVLMTEAAAKGAVCLDGSPGGFYYRKGTSNKWIIFHQGGGWCSSPTNCLDRSHSALGSSKSWGPTYTDAYEGSALFDTPPFDTFNVVYAMYCDGGSWSGDSEQIVNGTTIYYKGRPLLDALIDELMPMGLANADEAVYSGCSAGGLTAYIHVDYFHQRMLAVNPNTKVVGIADAMFSLNHNSTAGQPVFPDRMQWGYDIWNNSKSLNDKCVAHYGKSDGWKCMFGANVAPFIESNFFILNSKYDTWQAAAIVGVKCVINQCNGTDLAFFLAYGREMVAKLAQVPARMGAFLGNCPAHCQTGTGGDYYNRTVDGVSIATAISSWYGQAIEHYADPSFKAARHVAACEKIPCGTDVC